MRVEFFNVFNRTVLPMPSASNITLLQTLAISGFGRLNPASVARRARAHWPACGAHHLLIAYSVMRLGIGLMLVGAAFAGDFAPRSPCGLCLGGVGSGDWST